LDTIFSDNGIWLVETDNKKQYYKSKSSKGLKNDKAISVESI
jgi:hypothetical protein